MAIDPRSMYNQSRKSVSNVKTAPLRVGTAAPTANTPLNTPLKPVTNAPNFAKDLQDKVNAMYDAQQKARLQEFYATRDKGVADIKGQIGELNPQYADLRNQADVVSMQNQRAMAEKMANQGLQGSGENVTASLGLANARNQALSGLNLQQQKQTNEYNKRISDLNDPNNELKIKNALESERATALYEAYLKGDEVAFRNKAYDRDVFESDRGFNYTKGRDKISDTRYADETKYNRGRDKIADTRYTEERNYNRKITEREWNSMSPAEKQRMALQYSYSKKLGSGGGGGGGGTKSTKSTATKSQANAEKTFNSGKNQTGKPQNYSQYVSKQAHMFDKAAAHKADMKRINEIRKKQGLSPITVKSPKDDRGMEY